MSKIIAIAGKGGVGKTTFAALLVRYLMEEVGQGPILAVDADPNSNLNELLGVQVSNTIGDAREAMKKDVPMGMTKDIWFEYKVNEAVVEGKGFDLLVMGRPEGPGCYCAANSLVKKSMDALKDNYPFVVVDNEAGMEHISRLVTQDIDHLFVISDGTPRGIMTAGRILSLTGDLRLNIVKTSVIVNRLRPGNEDALKKIAKEKGLNPTGIMRYDETLALDDLNGINVFSLAHDSPALKDAFAVFRKTI